MTDAPLELRAFLTGTVVPIEAVPDPVFAQRLMGDGIAIDPTPSADSVLRAPCAGQVVQLHAARHACTLRTPAGARVLLHIGLDTVLLKGEGFIARVAEGDQVDAGQALIEFDPQVLRRHGKPLVTVLVVENGDEHPIGARVGAGSVTLGTTLLTLGRAVPAATAGPAVDDASDAERAHGWAVVRHGGGLHARPSARLVNALKPYAAQVQVQAHGRSANARSTSALMGLGVAEGEEVTILAAGLQAGDAVEAAIAVLETPSAGGHAAPAPSPAAVAPHAPDDLPAGQLAGVCASPGLAFGPALRWQPGAVNLREHGDGVVLETRALQAALQAMRAELQAAIAEAEHRRLDEQAQIFGAHLTLADDPELVAAAQRQVDTGRSAAFAWQAATREQCAALAATGQPLLAERAADLRDLERRVHRHLGVEPAGLPAGARGAVLLADDLTPSDVAGLVQAGVAAVATVHGGPTSHVAILARAHGLPALVALGPQLAQVADGTMLVVEADRGLLDTAPDADRLARIRDERQRRDTARAHAVAKAHEPARTRDGVLIEVAANIANADDAREAVRQGADAVGLLRTELLFLERETAPDAAEQQAAYQAVVEALQGRSAVIRTLDVGADKHLPYLPLPAEENPALGLRGIRLSLDREALLTEQLRGLLGVRPLESIRIMLPMVTDLSELTATRSAIELIAARLGITQRVELGVMIETPAAAVLADQLARAADFFSVGTNDLTQYTLCMDRCNPTLAARLDGLHPAVLRLIRLAAQGAQAHDRWIGVCGSLASERLAVPLLLGLGITELSASPAAIPEVKAVVRRLALDDCERVARQALELDSPDAVRRLVRLTWPGLDDATAA